MVGSKKYPKVHGFSEVIFFIQGVLFADSSSDYESYFGNNVLLLPQ
jgi:hypothetical protein